MEPTNKFHASEPEMCERGEWYEKLAGYCTCAKALVPAEIEGLECRCERA